MPERKRRPITELGRVRLTKEQALAGLRLMQLRERQKEWDRVVDATLSAPLIVMRDRLLAISDRLLRLTQKQSQILRQEI